MSTARQEHQTSKTELIAEIRCESPDDPQGCLVNALSCGDCDEPFQGKDGVGDVEAQEFPNLSQGNDEEDWIDDFLMEEDEADSFEPLLLVAKQQ